MKKINYKWRVFMDTNLKDTIVKLIKSNKEGDYWDFK